MKEKKAKRTEACDVLKRLGEAMISSDVASKEWNIFILIMKAFKGGNMKTPFYILGHKKDFDVCYWKLAIECDEKGHKEHNISYWYFKGNQQNSLSLQKKHAKIWWIVRAILKKKPKNVKNWLLQRK